MSTTTHPPIRVVIADDHEIFRDGFRILVKKQKDIELAGEAENGLELIRLVDKLTPDVIITDIKMPKMDGIQATKQLHSKYPDKGIIAFSMFDEDSLIIDMLEAGARGYLLKNASKKEVFEAIKTVHENGTFYCENTSIKLAQVIGKIPVKHVRKFQKPEFNDREIMIIRLICEELTNKEIALQMHLSVRTIEDYRGKIQEKMQAKNTAGIVIYAIRHNLYQV